MNERIRTALYVTRLEHKPTHTTHNASVVDEPLWCLTHTHTQLFDTDARTHKHLKQRHVCAHTNTFSADNDAHSIQSHTGTPTQTQADTH